MKRSGNCAGLGRVRRLNLIYLHLDVIILNSGHFCKGHVPKMCQQEIDKTLDIFTVEWKLATYE